jgi:hypothetical protein
MFSSQEKVVGPVQNHGGLTPKEKINKKHMILVNVHVHPGQKHVLRSGNMFDLVPNHGVMVETFS